MSFSRAAAAFLKRSLSSKDVFNSQQALIIEKIKSSYEMTNQIELFSP
jgi:hypothetical protein